MSKPLPTPEMLRKLLSYSPDTGELLWKPREEDMFQETGRPRVWSMRQWNSKFSGKPASAMKCAQYGQVGIFRKRYPAHRVAWAIYHGSWPKHQIDHINGNPSDNRISNLRDVSNQENSRNMSLSVANKSGFTGVRMESNGQWRAQITVNYKTVNLGSFDMKEDAITARRCANVKYKFHNGHGKTA